MNYMKMDGASHIRSSIPGVQVGCAAKPSTPKVLVDACKSQSLSLTMRINQSIKQLYPGVMKVDVGNGANSGSPGRFQAGFNSTQQDFFSGAVMAIHHASSGELIDIRPLNDSLKTTISNALFKSNHLEVSRMVLLAGKDVPPHQVEGEVTIQCLEGSVELAVAGITRSMRAGDLVCLAGRETYALSAVEDSSILITMLLHSA